MKAENWVLSGTKKSNMWIEGLVDAIPLVMGAFPFGLACGMMGITIGLKPLEILFMSAFVFAGSAQFTALTMLGSTTGGGGVVILTTLLINLRHLLMGFSLAPHMLALPKGLQALLAFLLTDEAYGVVMSRAAQKEYDSRHHLAVSLALYVAWFSATGMGVFLGQILPNPLAWGLDFAMYATFIILLIPMLKDRSSLAACLVAIPVSLVGARYLPGKWYVLLTCLVACWAGGLLERGDKNEN